MVDGWAVQDADLSRMVIKHVMLVYYDYPLRFT
jgi:hypothetical protein